jgi:hypothetical protein
MNRLPRSWFVNITVAVLCLGFALVMFMFEAFYPGIFMALIGVSFGILSIRDLLRL